MSIPSGTEMITFKARYGSHVVVHCIARQDFTYVALSEWVKGSFGVSLPTNKFGSDLPRLTYSDLQKDLVTISCDADLKRAVQQVPTDGVLELFLISHSWQSCSSPGLPTSQLGMFMRSAPYCENVTTSMGHDGLAGPKSSPASQLSFVGFLIRYLSQYLPVDEKDDQGQLLRDFTMIFPLSLLILLSNLLYILDMTDPISSNICRHVIPIVAALLMYIGWHGLHRIAPSPPLGTQAPRTTENNFVRAETISDFHLVLGLSITIFILHVLHEFTVSFSADALNYCLCITATVLAFIGWQGQSRFARHF